MASRNYISLKDAKAIVATQENDEDFKSLDETNKSLLETKGKMINYLIQRMVEVEYVLNDTKIDDNKELSKVASILKEDYAKKEKEILRIRAERKAADDKELSKARMILRTEYAKKEKDILIKRAAKRKILEKDLEDAEAAIRTLADYPHWSKLKKEAMEKYRIAKGKTEDGRKYNKISMPYAGKKSKSKKNAQTPPKTDAAPAAPQGL